MDVRGFIDENAASFFGALKDWLAIPSISADPARHADVRRSAEWLAGYLRETGFPVAEVWPAGTGGTGLPAVFAHWPAADPAAPVVLVYGHHDVQPVEPLEEWALARRSSPTSATGGCSGAARPTTRARCCSMPWPRRPASPPAGATAPPVTLKLLIEGEEESGSPNFAALLRSRRDRLACDVIVVSDTTMWAADVPSICTGMRGLIDAEIELRGPDRDLHSGSFGGGVPNPLHALAGLLAGLHDGDGRVTLARLLRPGRSDFRA